MRDRYIKITEVEALLVQRWEVNHDPNDAPYLIYADDGICWGVSEHPPLHLPPPVYYVKQEGRVGYYVSIEEFVRDFEALK